MIDLLPLAILVVPARAPELAPLALFDTPHHSVDNDPVPANITPPLYCGMFKVAPTKVDAPLVPVVVKVSAFCLPLNAVQSAALNAPLFAADAVGTLSVITGVVVPFATVELKSAPVVPNVNAATDVTVPPLDGAELVTVKLGYVPVTPIPVPAAIATTWSGAEFVTVTAVVAPDNEIPVPAVNPLVAREGPVPSFTKDSVPPAEDKVTPDVGSELLIVKFGYVPATPIPLPAVKATTWSGAVLVTVTAVVVPDNEIPVPDVKPLVAREGPVPSFTKDSVPPAEDNETPDVGSVLLIVKLGYVPATPIPEPAVKATVWSGAVLVIVKLGYVPDVDIPVPELNTTVWSGAVFAIV